MKRIVISTLSIAMLMFVACKKDPKENKDVFNGPEVNMGNGKAWAWVKLDAQQKPQALGISFTPSALVNLPQGGEGHAHESNFILKLPAQKSLTPFDHIGLNWNPNGHEPENIYGLPHFDFHYYMESEAYVDAIPLYEQAPADFDNAPAAHYFHPDYMGLPGGAPKMGKHWVDVTSPELNPQNPAIFTETFIMGSYKGKQLFYEPMITKQFIEAQTNFEKAIKVPAKFERDGYYPTKYRIVKTSKTIDIILEGFVLRQKS
jgi:hypothetical protein